ncbi:methionine--tRNA ligase [Synechococcales cyanobacterium C]|uniref:Methionine--tRNA ligase n=1 Tax=Petrachloros mirabilis ULC683 TaxID=2781853 RepID=A0A8K2A0C4_9CYAN|nr:methionine--tRNA ligase [Petrachloros mirabilis]NCJ07112.1 methionine--tRNA ligase [Petrachloros mirabilis ULC683]
MTLDQKPRFSITTPLYYVNALPHIGSAYTTIAADAIARYYRLQGHDVLLITGTDEHGQKIERTAKQLGRSPQDHCDQIAAGFIDLWQRLNIQYDRFSRTTSDRHHQIVNEFFQRVWDRGDIYPGQQQGWYCVDCEEFKDEKELLPEHYCPIHTHRQAEWRDEENYFFRLSAYQDTLLDFYAHNPDFIQPAIRRNEVLSFVSQGLRDFSISRRHVDWGFPVPIAPDQTLYVWFDALLGYITALLDAETTPSLDHALTPWWPINLHLIGKDILRFHAVYWPAMLMSAELPLPQQVFGHGFLTKEGQKMGKSLGNTLDPYELVNRYGADAVRYYFLKEIEFGRDGDFSETRFINILNADLANDLGNLLNRTLKMAFKYCDGTVPPISEPEQSQPPFLANFIATIGSEVAQAYQSLNFSHACHLALTLVKAGNKFVDEQAPWTLYKQQEITQVHRVLYGVLEAVRLAAYLLAPIVPDLSTQVYIQLGLEIDFQAQPQKQTPKQLQAPLNITYINQSQWGVLQPGQPLGMPQPVFQKLEPLSVTTA